MNFAYAKKQIGIYINIKLPVYTVKEKIELCKKAYIEKNKKAIDRLGDLYRIGNESMVTDYKIKSKEIEEWGIIKDYFNDKAAGAKYDWTIERYNKLKKDNNIKELD
jgi:hypothetical protein